MTYMPSNAFVNKSRFIGDIDSLKELKSDKEVKSSSKKIIEAAKNSEPKRKSELLQRSLKIRPKLTPNISNMIEESQNILHLKNKTIDAFIYSSPELNAWCSYYGTEMITIGISSELIKAMSDTELMFVIGHEFGHAKYNHYQLPTQGIMRGERLNPTRALKLMSWSRQAEISADRAGLLCCQDINAATSSFIKLSCGLGEPYVHLDTEAFVQQLNDLQNLSEEMDEDDLTDCYSTHPFNPLRVIAIQNFWSSESFCKFLKIQKENVLSDEERDKRILDLLDIMEPAAQSKTEDKRENDLILWAGYYVTIADGDFAKEESKSLADICTKKRVKEALDAISKAKNKNSFIEKQLNQAIENYPDLSHSKKCSIMQKVITISRADGVLSDEEREALYHLADILKINPKFIGQILKILD